MCWKTSSFAGPDGRAGHESQLAGVNRAAVAMRMDRRPPGNCFMTKALLAARISSGLSMRSPREPLVLRGIQTAVGCDGDRRHASSLVPHEESEHPGRCRRLLCTYLVLLRPGSTIQRQKLCAGAAARRGRPPIPPLAPTAYTWATSAAAVQSALRTRLCIVQ